VLNGDVWSVEVQSFTHPSAATRITTGTTIQRYSCPFAYALHHNLSESGDKVSHILNAGCEW
jgi:hypothetical protein